MLITTVNRLTEAGRGAVVATIYHGFMTVADAFARCAKGKTSATVILSAVVHVSYLKELSFGLW